jgi:hypothetical protein
MMSNGFALATQSIEEFLPPLPVSVSSCLILDRGVQDILVPKRDKAEKSFDV